MDNNGCILATVLGAWVLSIGVLVTASPARDNTSARPQSTADPMAAHRQTRPDADAGGPASAHLSQTEKSRHAPPGTARTPGDQPQLSMPAGK